MNVFCVRTIFKNLRLIKQGYHNRFLKTPARHFYDLKRNISILYLEVFPYHPETFGNGMCDVHILCMDESAKYRA